MRKITIGLSVLLGLTLILAAVAVAFILTLDPNRLKPIIEEAAYKQGIELSLEGDLSWRFFPTIGLHMAGVTARNADSQDELATLDSAGLSVALKPLFQRKIEVVGLDIKGASVSYSVDESGQSNWPVPTASTDEPSRGVDEPEVGEPQVPTSNVSSLSLTDAALNYRDASGALTEISGLDLSAQNFNLQGYSFDTQLQGQLKLAEYPLMKLSADSAMSLDLAAKRSVIEALVVELIVGEHKELAQANAKLNAKINADITWAGPWSVKGMLSADTLDLRSLMEQLGISLPTTRGSEVLKSLAVESRIQLNGDHLMLNDVDVALDEMLLTAGVEVRDFDSPQIGASISINKVILDPYLAPPATAAELEAPVVAAPPTPLPLELLRSLNAKVALDIGELTVNGMQALAISATLKALDGLVEVKPAELTLAGGQVGATLSLDARKASAKVVGELTTDGVMIDLLMQQLKQEPILAGALNSQVKFKSHGDTDEDLLDNLLADINVASTRMKLTTINIEKRFCEAVALLKGKVASENDWPEYSELAPLNLKAHFADDKVILDGLSAELQKLEAQSTGQIDLKTGNFRFPLDVRLSKFATSLDGCVIVDEKWRQRSVPLRCKGNLSDIGAKTCLPDGPRITEQLKGKAKEELDEELSKAKDKLNDKAEKEADRFLEKHLDESEIEKLKDSVKDLFNRK